MSILDTLIARRARRQTYASLRHLDDHMLRDIGFERDRYGRFLGRDFARLQDLGR